MSFILCMRCNKNPKKSGKSKICFDCAEAIHKEKERIRYQNKIKALSRVPAEGMMTLVEAKLAYECELKNLYELAKLTGLTYNVVRQELLKMGMVMRRVGRNGRDAKQQHEDNKDKPHNEPAGKWNSARSMEMLRMRL